MLKPQQTQALVQISRYLEEVLELLDRDDPIDRALVHSLSRAAGGIEVALVTQRKPPGRKK